MSSHRITAITTKVIRKNVLLSIALTVTIAGTILFSIIPPLILEQIVNKLTDNKIVSIGLALGYLALLSITGVFEALKEFLITIFGQKMTHALRSEMCDKLSKLKADYYANNDIGVITSRFVNDVDTVENLFTSGIISMFIDTCRIVSILCVIWYKSKGLGILMLAAIPVIFFLTRFIQKRMLSAQLDNRKAVGLANAFIPDTLRCIRTIHVYGKEKHMKNKYHKIIDSGYMAMEKSNFYDAVYSPIIIEISTVIIAFMMVMAAKNGMIRDFFGMSVGTAVAVIAYVGRIFDPIETIGMEIQNIQSAIAGVKRINEFLNEESKKDTNAKLTVNNIIDKNTDCIVFDNVDFGYVEGKKVLSNQSFTIGYGENVTFTGKTGVGKSTVFKLILGLYEPDSGEVYVFGRKASEIPDEIKRHIFGYVEQDFKLIPGTILDQITLKDNLITKKEAVDAAKLVGLHNFIVAFDEGYDTKCTNSLFSKGQWQLLSIARAIAANPAILLLDEITANLDSETEQMVIKAILSASQNRTLISISHRLVEVKNGTRQIELYNKETEKNE